MRSVTQVHLVDAGAETDRALARAVAAARGASGLAPVTVASATPYAALLLRRAWGRRAAATGAGGPRCAGAGGGGPHGAGTGFANLRFVPFTGLAAALGGPPLRRDGHRPLTPPVERAAVRVALGRHPGHLGPLGSEAAAGGLLTAFRRLRRLDAGGPPARSRGRHAEVRSMYATFRGVVAGHHDAEDRARSAAAAVAAGEPHTLDAGHVVLHLPGTLSPAETELVARLADLGRLSAVLATTGDPVADEPVLALAGTLGRLTGTTVRGGTDPRSGRGGVATDPLIVSAPDPEEEIREAVRLMLDRASSGGVAFHHMAILYADPEPYATIADQVLAEAGVLRHGPGPRRLGDSVAGRALVGLLELAAEGPDPLGIERWLAGTPATDPGAFPRGPGGSGPDHLVERLAAELQPPVPATWASLATWARSLLDTYLDPEGGPDPWPDPEMESFHRLHLALDAIAGIDRIGVPADLAAFRAEVAQELGAPSGGGERFGEGMFVGPLGSTSGAAFDTVAVVGMAEGRYPPRPAPDPFLGAALAPGGAEAARRHHLLAVASARNVILSFPRGDSRSGRRHLPSPWLLEAASRRAGHPLPAGALAATAGFPWFRFVSSFEETLAGSASPASVVEAELRSLHGWRSAGHRLEAHPIVVARPGLAAGLELTRGRASHRLTRFDGLCGPHTPGSTSTTEPDPAGPVSVSVTALERWAACPFRSFLHDVLGVAEPEPPPDTGGPGPADRGMLLHAVLAEFIAAAPPRLGPGQPWTREERDLMRDLAERLCDRHERRWRPGRPDRGGGTGPANRSPAWEVERRRIVRSAVEFLDADEEVRRTLGVVPHRDGVEVGFGRPSDPLPGPTIATSRGPVALRGRIDRIDRSPDGRRLVVYDYKTGRSVRADASEALARGTGLQLPAYAVAAASALAPGEAGGTVGDRGAGGDEAGAQGAGPAALYWPVGPSARRRPDLSGFDAVGPEIVRRLEEPVAVIVGAMSDGLYPAVADDTRRSGRGSSCAACGYRRLCAATRGAPWERKSLDPAAAPYVGLSARESTAGPGTEPA